MVSSSTDPGINQFNQPDILIPNLYNSLDWNRYSYTKLNPLKYTDPSGHSAKLISPDDVLIIIVGVIFAIAIPINYDNRRRANFESLGCEGSLAECFINRQTKDFSANEQISQDEFTEMLEVIAQDLESKFRTPFDPARAGYDTPFFTGNSMFFGEINRPDQLVCFDSQCYQQSGVNYVAQGMYSAFSGENLSDAKEKANDWNLFWYNHEATQDELFWLEYGYNYYNNRKSRKDTQPR